MSQPRRPLSLRLRHLAEYAGLRAVAGLIRLLPVDAASAFMGWCWRHIAPRTKRHERALDHVAMALPELDSEARERLVRDMWANLGRIMAETFHLDRLWRKDARFEYDLDAVADVLSDHSRGCVIVSLHTGNWEVVAHPAGHFGLEVGGVYQALSNPLSDAYVSRLRAPFFAGGLYPKGPYTARKLLALVRGGGVISFLADQRDVKGIRVPFFGHEAWANPFPAMLAQTCDVPLVAVRVIRTKGVHFRITGELVDIPRGGDRTEDAQAGTERLHEVFERWIREHPEQWMWIHRKWSDGGHWL